MGEERARILGMLSAGKITAEEAEQLLDALETRAGTPEASSGAPATGSAIKGDPKPLLDALPRFLFVKVVSTEGDNVDVKVPIALVRSGLKLTSLIPPEAMARIDEEMTGKGISLDFSNLKAEDIDELVEGLREMEITVNSANGDNVRVWAE